MSVKLWDFQAEAIEGLRANIRGGVVNQILAAPTGSGKCHGPDTPIMMADGNVRMVQDIRVGDRLLGPDGTARTVLALGRGREMMYRVVPKKGAPYTCNESHILSLRKSGPDGINLADGSHIARRADVVAVPLPVYLDSNRTAKHCLKGWRSGPVEFPDAESAALPIPPYILGAWLGDGIAKAPAIAKPHCRMVEEWIAYCRSVGVGIKNLEAREGRCPVYHASNGQTGPRENPVTAALRAAGVFGDKHIPQSYRTASIADRLELLAGLLDSDGHVDRNGYDWITKDEAVANDFAFVARSLGFSCYVTPCLKGIKDLDFVGNYWRCSLSGDTERIPCRDKEASTRLQKKRHRVHGIRIQPLGVGDYFGFQISGDHLYLLGDFTVCHNTECATYLIEECLAKGKRAVFLADRVSLIGQTSERFDRYGIPHGVIQADHWRRQTYQQIQVASVQTIARRQWPPADLIIVDEAHTISQTTIARIAARDTICIGLTATPFTKGLGKHYDAVVSVTTTNKLIADGYLSSYRIFAASEPDMSGAKVVAGEWTDEEAEKRAMPIIGDCVAEYLKHGDGKKFICFGVNVAHCEEMQRQFMAAGIQCGLYTYRTGDAERKEMVTEFKKPDSYLRGLISVAALAKGFDVPDVEVVIMARPLRSSLTEHIQIMGRGLRSHPGKSECLILDHAGNCMRFWDPMNNFFENGASELDDGKRKPKDPKKPEPKEPKKCPQCHHVHPPRPHCPACGFEYPRPKSTVQHVPGNLHELVGKGVATVDQQQALYSQLVYIQQQRGYKAGWVKHQYKERTGAWPSGLMDVPMTPTPAVRRWVKSRLIRYAKGKGKGGGNGRRATRR